MRILVFLFALGVFLASCAGENKGKSPSSIPSISRSSNSLVDRGRSIFMANCSSCHNMTQDMAAIHLAGVIGRWNGDTNSIKTFIKNPLKMLEEKNSHAMAAYKYSEPVVMPSFPNLTDGELTAILAYISSYPE